MYIQVDCHIWKKRCERVEPLGKGVEYAYQVRYWKKLPKAKKKPPVPAPEATATAAEEVIRSVVTVCELFLHL